MYSKWSFAPRIPISLVLVVTTGLVWRLSCSERSCLFFHFFPCHPVAFFSCLLLSLPSPLPLFHFHTSLHHILCYTCPLCLFARYTPFDITTSIYPTFVLHDYPDAGWSDLTFSLKARFLAHHRSTGDPYLFPHLDYQLLTIDYSIFDSYTSDRLVSPPPSSRLGSPLRNNLKHSPSDSPPTQLPQPFPALIQPSLLRPIPV